MSSAGIEAIAHPTTNRDSFQHQTVHRIRSDQEAIRTAQQIATQFETEASERDQNRRLPYTEIELLTLDDAEEVPSEATVATVSIAVAEAKVLATEIAILVTNKLFELAGTQSPGYLAREVIWSGSPSF